MIRNFLIQILLLCLFCKTQSQDLTCDEGITCDDKDSCESFLAEHAKLGQLRNGTSERRLYFKFNRNNMISNF